MNADLIKHNRNLRRLQKKLGLNEEQYQETLYQASGKQHVSDMTPAEAASAAQHFMRLACESVVPSFPCQADDARFRLWRLAADVTPAQRKHMLRLVLYAEEKRLLTDANAYLKKRVFKDKTVLAGRDVSAAIAALRKAINFYKAK